MDGQAAHTTAVLEEVEAAGLLALVVEGVGLLALEVVEVVDLEGLLLVVVNGLLVLRSYHRYVQGGRLHVVFLSE